MASTPDHWFRYSDLKELIEGECAMYRGKPKQCFCDCVADSRRPPTAPRWHVPKGGGAHGYASMHCPHWYGGWCKINGLPPDPKSRTNCVLIDWNAGVPPCEYFERELLPEAMAEVERDYRWRVGPVPDGWVETDGKCLVLEPKRVRCLYFVQSLLPILPAHLLREFNTLFKENDDGGEGAGGDDAQGPREPGGTVRGIPREPLRRGPVR